MPVRFGMRYPNTHTSRSKNSVNAEDCKVTEEGTKSTRCAKQDEPSVHNTQTTKPRTYNPRTLSLLKHTLAASVADAAADAPAPLTVVATTPDVEPTTALPTRASPLVIATTPPAPTPEFPLPPAVTTAAVPFPPALLSAANVSSVVGVGVTYAELGSAPTRAPDVYVSDTIGASLGTLPAWRLDIANAAVRLVPL